MLLLEHLWADRFEGELANVFELQDQMTTSVVGAIAPKLEQAEIERAKRKPTESLDAYDYYLRGWASADLVTREATSDALRLFYRAIDLDPDFALAHGRAAVCYMWRASNGWLTDRFKRPQKPSAWRGGRPSWTRTKRSHSAGLG